MPGRRRKRLFKSCCQCAGASDADFNNASCDVYDDVLQCDWSLQDPAYLLGEPYYSDTTTFATPTASPIQTNRSADIHSVFDSTRGARVSGREAIRTGIYDDKCFVYVDRKTQRFLSESEAVSSGLITKIITDVDGDNPCLEQTQSTIVSVFHPKTKKFVDVKTAVADEIIDHLHGNYINSEKGKSMTFKEAESAGFIKTKTFERSDETYPHDFNSTEPWSVLNLNDASLLFYDRAGKTWINRIESEKIGQIVDGHYVDAKSGLRITLDTAYRCGIVRAVNNDSGLQDINSIDQSESTLDLCQGRKEDKPDLDVAESDVVMRNRVESPTLSLTGISIACTTSDKMVKKKSSIFNKLRRKLTKKQDKESREGGRRDDVESWLFVNKNGKHIPLSGRMADINRDLVDPSTGAQLTVLEGLKRNIVHVASPDIPHERKDFLIERDHQLIIVDHINSVLSRSKKLESRVSLTSAIDSGIFDRETGRLQVYRDNRLSHISILSCVREGIVPGRVFEIPAWMKTTSSSPRSLESMTASQHSHADHVGCGNEDRWTPVNNDKSQETASLDTESDIVIDMEHVPRLIQSKHTPKVDREATDVILSDISDSKTYSGNITENSSAVRSDVDSETIDAVTSGEVNDMFSETTGKTTLNKEFNETLVYSDHVNDREARRHMIDPDGHEPDDNVGLDKTSHLAVSGDIEDISEDSINEAVEKGGVTEKGREYIQSDVSIGGDQIEGSHEKSVSISAIHFKELSQIHDAINSFVILAAVKAKLRQYVDALWLVKDKVDTIESVLIETETNNTAKLQEALVIFQKLAADIEDVFRAYESADVLYHSISSSPENEEIGTLILNFRNSVQTRLEPIGTEVYTRQKFVERVLKHLNKFSDTHRLLTLACDEVDGLLQQMKDDLRIDLSKIDSCCTAMKATEESLAIKCKLVEALNHEMESASENLIILTKISNVFATACGDFSRSSRLFGPDSNVIVSSSNNITSNNTINDDAITIMKENLTARYYDLMRKTNETRRTMNDLMQEHEAYRASSSGTLAAFNGLENDWNSLAASVDSSNLTHDQLLATQKQICGFERRVSSLSDTIKKLRRSCDNLVQILTVHVPLINPTQLEEIKGPVKELVEGHRSLTLSIASRLAAVNLNLTKSYNNENNFDEAKKYLTKVKEQMSVWSNAQININVERLNEQLNKLKSMENGLSEHINNLCAMNSQSDTEALLEQLNDSQNEITEKIDRTSKAKQELASLNDEIVNIYDRLNDCIISLQSLQLIGPPRDDDSSENIADDPNTSEVLNAVKSCSDYLLSNEARVNSIQERVSNLAKLIGVDCGQISTVISDLRTAKDWISNDLSVLRNGLAEYEVAQIEYDNICREIKCWINGMDVVLDQTSRLRCSLKSLEEEFERCQDLLTEYEKCAMKVDSLKVHDEAMKSLLMNIQASFDGLTKRDTVLENVEAEADRCLKQSHQIEDSFSAMGDKLESRKQGISRMLLTIRQHTKASRNAWKIMLDNQRAMEDLNLAEGLPCSTDALADIETKVAKMKVALVNNTDVLELVRSSFNEIHLNNEDNEGSIQTHEIDEDDDTLERMEKLELRWTDLMDSLELTTERVCSQIIDVREFLQSNECLMDDLKSRDKFLELVKIQSSDETVLTMTVQNLQNLQSQHKESVQQVGHLNAVVQRIYSRSRKDDSDCKEIRNQYANLDQLCQDVDIAITEALRQIHKITEISGKFQAYIQTTQDEIAEVEAKVNNHLINSSDMPADELTDLCVALSSKLSIVDATIAKCRERLTFQALPADCAAAVDLENDLDKIAGQARKNQHIIDSIIKKVRLISEQPCQDDSLLVLVTTDPVKKLESLECQLHTLSSSIPVNTDVIHQNISKLERLKAKYEVMDQSCENMPSTTTDLDSQSVAKRFEELGRGIDSLHVKLLDCEALCSQFADEQKNSRNALRELVHEINLYTQQISNSEKDEDEFQQFISSVNIRLAGIVPQSKSATNLLEIVNIEKQSVVDSIKSIEEAKRNIEKEISCWSNFSSPTMCSVQASIIPNIQIEADQSIDGTTDQYDSLNPTYSHALAKPDGHSGRSQETDVIHDEDDDNDGSERILHRGLLLIERIKGLRNNLLNGSGMESIPMLVDQLASFEDENIQLNSYFEGMSDKLSTTDIERAGRLMDTLMGNIDDLRCIVDNRHVKNNERIVEELSSLIQDISCSLSKSANLLAKSEPVSVHPDKLNSQKEEIEGTILELTENKSSLEFVKKQIEALLNTSAQDTLEDMLASVGTLSTEVDAMESAATARRDQLIAVLELVDDFWRSAIGAQNMVEQADEDLQRIQQAETSGQHVTLMDQKQMITEIQGTLNSNNFSYLISLREDLSSILDTDDYVELNAYVSGIQSAQDILIAEAQQNIEQLDQAITTGTYFYEKIMGLLKWMVSRGDDVDDKLVSSVAIEYLTNDNIKGIHEFRDELDRKFLEIQGLKDLAEALSINPISGQSRHDDEFTEKIYDPVQKLIDGWERLQGPVNDRANAIDKHLLKKGHSKLVVKATLDWMQLMSTHYQVYAENCPFDCSRHLLPVMKPKEATVKLLDEIAAKDTNSELGPLLGNLKTIWTMLKKASMSDGDVKTSSEEQGIQLLLSFARNMSWLQSMEVRLSDSRAQAGASKDVKSQLQTFMDTCNEVEKYGQQIEDLLAVLSQHLKSQDIRQKHDLLKRRWLGLQKKVSDRKERLEDVSRDITEFDSRFREFVSKLSEMERRLSETKQTSRDLQRIERLISDHQDFEVDMTELQHELVQLDKLGTKIRFKCRSGDSVMLKNLLFSTRHRWEKLMSRWNERGRILDRLHRETKKFYEEYNGLTGWLTAVYKDLENEDFAIEPDSGDDQDGRGYSQSSTYLIEMARNHKILLREVELRRSTFDRMYRQCRRWMDGFSYIHADERTVLKDLASALKDVWQKVNVLSNERRRVIDSMMLLHGKVSELARSTITWLDQVEQLLQSTDDQYCGDLVTVQDMCERHDLISSELLARSDQLNLLLKEGEQHLTDDYKRHLHDSWERVKKRVNARGQQLSTAMQLAYKFEQQFDSFISWSDAMEDKLKSCRGFGSMNRRLIEEDAQRMSKCLESILKYENLVAEMKEVADAILENCNQLSVETINRNVSIVDCRMNAILDFAGQKEEQFKSAMNSVMDYEATVKDIADRLQTLEQAQRMLNTTPPSIVNPLSLSKESVGSGQVGSNQDELGVVEHLTRSLSEAEYFVGEVHEVAAAFERLVKAHKKPLRYTPKWTTRAKTPVSPTIVLPILNISTDSAAFSADSRLLEILASLKASWGRATGRVSDIRERLEKSRELEVIRAFNFDEWCQRYRTFLKDNRSRVIEAFKNADRTRMGKITKADFVEAVISSKFTTDRTELEMLADVFDSDDDGYINYKDFLATLQPDREVFRKPTTDLDHIRQELSSQVNRCRCSEKYPVKHVAEGKYRFGSSQRYRLVRILQSTVMVRVGGGWVSLAEFLSKNDPCRVQGRTNLELRDQFLSASEELAGKVKSCSAHNFNVSTVLSPFDRTSVSSPFLTALASSESSHAPDLVDDRTTLNTDSMTLASLDDSRHNQQQQQQPGPHHNQAQRHHQALGPGRARVATAAVRSVLTTKQHQTKAQQKQRPSSTGRPRKKDDLINPQSSSKAIPTSKSASALFKCPPPLSFPPSESKHHGITSSKQQRKVDSKSIIAKTWQRRFADKIDVDRCSSTDPISPSPVATVQAADQAVPRNDGTDIPHQEEKPAVKRSRIPVSAKGRSFSNQIDIKTHDIEKAKPSSFGSTPASPTNIIRKGASAEVKTGVERQTTEPDTTLSKDHDPKSTNV